MNDPLSFVSLFSFEGDNTAAKVSSTGITDLTGVAALQFDLYDNYFSATNDLAINYREIDVIGSAVAIPEPSRAVLLGFAALGVLFRRRR